MWVGRQLVCFALLFFLNANSSSAHMLCSVTVNHRLFFFDTGFPFVVLTIV